MTTFLCGSERGRPIFSTLGGKFVPSSGTKSKAIFKGRKPRFLFFFCIRFGKPNPAIGGEKHFLGARVGKQIFNFGEGKDFSSYFTAVQWVKLRAKSGFYIDCLPGRVLFPPMAKKS